MSYVNAHDMSVSIVEFMPVFIGISCAICYFLEVIQYSYISPVELCDNICCLCNEPPEVLVFGVCTHLSNCLY